jgi:hypothetical protein
MNIKIVRLKSGEDVIASLEDSIDKDKVVLYYPMSFHIVDRNRISQIVLAHYLPYQLIEEDMCILDSEEVLFYLDPNDQFKEYYVNSVEKLVRSEQEPIDVSDSMIQSLMDMDLEHTTKH